MQAGTGRKRGESEGEVLKTELQLKRYRKLVTKYI